MADSGDGLPTKLIRAPARLAAWVGALSGVSALLLGLLIGYLVWG